MKIYKFTHRGTEVNKISFCEIEDYLIKKGFNINESFYIMADEKEYIYVSNGFVRGLISDTNEIGEWHHYFKLEEDYFVACKMKFPQYSEAIL
jgi:hypothetical protein